MLRVMWSEARRAECAPLLIHSWMENDWIYIFPLGKLYVSCKQSRPGYELLSSYPFPLIITVTLQTPPNIHIYI